MSSLVYTAQRFLFSGPSGENILDTGAPFYDTYQTKDGHFISIGALEPQFFKQLMKGITVIFYFNFFEAYFSYLSCEERDSAVPGW